MSESPTVSQLEFGQMMYRNQVSEMKEAIQQGFDLHKFEKQQKISIIAQLMLRNPERDFFYREIPFFLEQGASLKGLPDTIGEIPMSVAVEFGNREYINYFLEQGADINRQRPHWGGCLHDAIRSDHLDLIPILLAHGADPKLGPKDGKNAFEYLKNLIKKAAKEGKTPEEQKYFNLYKYIKENTALGKQSKKKISSKQRVYMGRSR